MNFSAKAGCYGLYIAILVHWRVHVWEFPASANGHSSSDILGPGVDCSMEYSVLQPQRIENHCVTIILSCKNSKRLSWLVASIHALKSVFFLYIQCPVLSSHQCGVCLPWAQRDQRASYWCNMKLNQSNWYGTSISLRSLVGAFASSSNLSKLKPLSYSAIWSTNVTMWCYVGLTTSALPPQMQTRLSLFHCQIFALENWPAVVRFALQKSFIPATHAESSVANRQRLALESRSLPVLMRSRLLAPVCRGPQPGLIA